jgi:hypothetical protein
VGVIIFGHIRFGFFFKKSNQTGFFKIKKSKPIQTNQFWFGYFGKKPVQTGLVFGFSPV